MKNRIALFLADGFEETEAVTTIDLLRRAGLSVCTLSITNNNIVKGANGISLFADELMANFQPDLFDMIILPGGMPGTLNLKNDKQLLEAIGQFAAQEKYLAAICAAPSIFGEMGLLKGKEATCYPGFEDKLLEAKCLTEEVVTDGNIITSRGVGTAISFALTIIAKLVSEAKASEIAKGIVYKQ